MQPALRRRFWWGATGLYAAAVLFLSVIPVETEVEIPHLDKAVHLCEYLLFAWLLVQAVRIGSRLPAAPDDPFRGAAQAGMPERAYLLWAWIYATSFGLLVELIQAMIPWRSAELVDGLVNALGAAAGVWIGERWPRAGRDGHAHAR